ncbi:MAG TPA: hypothetical protein VFG53_19885 [Anaeromyxobacter sp.]|nr:hypothetical protein [Anaeromyxobacter sp.]
MAKALNTASIVIGRNWKGALPDERRDLLAIQEQLRHLARSLNTPAAPEETVTP